MVRETYQTLRVPPGLGPSSRPGGSQARAVVPRGQQDGCKMASPATARPSHTEERRGGTTASWTQGPPAPPDPLQRLVAGRWPCRSPEPAVLTGCKSPAEGKSHLAVLILAALCLAGRISWLDLYWCWLLGLRPQAGGGPQAQIATGAQQTWGPHLRRRQ